MMRALFSGVSGMRNHQIRMDVIGNNIANLNTIGYKASRVSFAEALAMTIRGATGPSQTRGGINPSQIGLGMTLGFIDTVFQQGSLETTNIMTDLAINGDGFFVLSDGQKQYYTRAGSFRFDAKGRLVNPANGMVVQGKIANADGKIDSATMVQDIVLPLGQRVAAKATTSVNFVGNLDAGESPLGTILDSNKMLAVEEAGDDSDVNGLFARGNSNSTIRGLRPGLSTVTVSDGTTTKVYTYVEVDTGTSNADFHSLDDLIAEINNDFSGSMQVQLDSSGALVIQDLSGSEHIVSFASDNPALNAALSAANGTIDSSAGKTAKTDEFSHVATASEELVKLRNAQGVSLGLKNGDTINIGANVGGTNVTGSFSVTNTSTLGDLADAIKTTFNIQNENGVIIDSDGSLKISGDPGKDNAISGVAIRETANNTFNTSMTFNELQKAKDVVHSTSITVYDALGEEHVLTMTFKKTNIKNQWEWEATLDGKETISAGNKGIVTFNADGSLNTFTYENGVSAFEFDPGTGADIMKIQFEVGNQGGFNGITQFSSSSTTVANSQNGYTNGDLVNINIDQTGKITGIFSNGVNKTLAQLVLAKFTNPNGLYREGDNLYSISANSGLPIYATAGETIQSQIVPGTLEMSNVNLAQEFTDMILAQRGFQANARVISTSDDLLNELVNIKR